MAECGKADCAFFMALKIAWHPLQADEALAAAKQAKQGKAPHETPAGEANCGNAGSPLEADPMQGQPGLLSDQHDAACKETSEAKAGAVTVSHVED
eukprot:scaffold82422_cov34-Prasinocladus_malaysianus.AAC.1